MDLETCVIYEGELRKFDPELRLIGYVMFYIVERKGNKLVAVIGGQSFSGMDLFGDGDLLRAYSRLAGKPRCIVGHGELTAAMKLARPVHRDNPNGHDVDAIAQAIVELINPSMLDTITWEEISRNRESREFLIRLPDKIKPGSKKAQEWWTTAWQEVEERVRPRVVVSIIPTRFVEEKRGSGEWIFIEYLVRTSADTSRKLDLSSLKKQLR